MKKLITDKTLAAFEKWFYDNHGKCSKKYEELLSWQKSEIMDWVFNACETIQHAFLIEFFDSVGIWREAFYLTDNETLDGNIVPWNYTCLRALEKANEIFNDR